MSNSRKYLMVKAGSMLTECVMGLIFYSPILTIVSLNNNEEALEMT